MKLQPNSVKNVTILSCAIVFTLLITGCTEKQIYSEQELSSLIDNALEISKEKHNPSNCAQLQENVIYESFGPKDISMGNFNASPKTACLKKYYEETNDPSACALMDDANASTCYTYFAEMHSDSSYCNNISSPDGITRCKAIAELNWQICYDLRKDDNDNSKYPSSVGWCIGEIVDRTKNYTACLNIDSSDYGDQWILERNGCIQNAMYGSQSTNGGQANITRWLCEYMISNEDEPWNDVENCEKRKGETSTIGVSPKLEQ